MASFTSARLQRLTVLENAPWVALGLDQYWEMLAPARTLNQGPEDDPDDDDDDDDGDDDDGDDDDWGAEPEGIPGVEEWDPWRKGIP